MCSSLCALCVQLFLHFALSFLPVAFLCLAISSLRTLCLCVKALQISASEIPARPAPIPPPLPCPLASPDRPAWPAQSADPRFASLKSPRFLAPLLRPETFPQRDSTPPSDPPKCPHPKASPHPNAIRAPCSPQAPANNSTGSATHRYLPMHPPCPNNPSALGIDKAARQSVPSIARAASAYQYRCQARAPRKSLVRTEF